MGSEKNKDTTHGDEIRGEQESTIRLGAEQPVSDMPGKIAASLLIKKGYKKGAEYSITTSRTVIGRGTGADIIVDDPAVSRMHAAIEFSEAKFLLKDLGSKNGTFRDGRSIKESVLRHGDTFQIGSTILEFVLTDRPGESVYVIE
jgi:pSer/pThr/pTyr-binding forkhead associated (FHA) protein